MLIRSVAKEEGRNRIRANCVGPDWIDAWLDTKVVEEELPRRYIEASSRRAAAVGRGGRRERGRLPGMRREPLHHCKHHLRRWRTALCDSGAEDATIHEWPVRTGGPYETGKQGRPDHRRGERSGARSQNRSRRRCVWRMSCDV